MKLSFIFKHWLKHKSLSYINKDLDFNTLERFDMGGQYPDPHAAQLKEAIAKSHRIERDMITVSNGADELIETIPRIMINPGDHAMVITPTFFRFIDSSQRSGAKVIAIRTTEQNGFIIDEKIINQVIKQANKANAKLIWLCSPNNPTGLKIKMRLIKKVIKNTKAFIIVNQVFIDLLETRDESLELIKDNKNVILIRSLSKAHGLAGLRVGFGLAHKETIKIFEKWRLPFNISTHSQQRAIQVLKNTKSIEKIRKAIKKERQFLFNKIKKLPNFIIGSKSETNIFLLKHKTKNLFKELLKRNILAADLRNSSGLEGLKFVRIAVQNRTRNKLLIDALTEISKMM